MSDYERFIKSAKWSQVNIAQATPGEPAPWAGSNFTDLPTLSELVASATVTPLQLGEKEYRLVAFGDGDARAAWLTTGPRDADDAAFPPPQRQVLAGLGGIVEVYGVDDGWWSTNHHGILTVESAALDVNDTLEAYAWAWEDEGLEIPIDGADYYVVAQEANGNLTLAHRDTGEVLLFAPDHAYDGVTELEGCPPYSLYTIDDAPDLAAWIELNARAALGK